MRKPVASLSGVLIEPPNYRPGVLIDSAGDAASASGADALSISSAICSCAAAAAASCSFTQGAVAPQGAFGFVLPLHDDRPRTSVPITTPNTLSDLAKYDRSHYAMWLLILARSIAVLALCERAGLHVGFGPLTVSDAAPPRPAAPAHPRHAPGSLDPVAGAPTGNKCTGKAHIREVDRDRLAEHPSRPREVSSPSRRRRHGSIVAQMARKWCPLALC